MLQNYVQEQLDKSADALQRSVAIDDVTMNFVASSKHFGDADDARIRAILGRNLDRETARYLLDFGIATTTEPLVLIPASKALAIAARRCFPIRWEEQTVGFLWLIDTGSAADDPAAITLAETLGLALFTLRLERQRSGDATEVMARDLISPERPVAEHAVEALRTAGRFTEAAGLRALAIATDTDHFPDVSHLDRVKQIVISEALRVGLEPPIVGQVSTNMVAIIPFSEDDDREVSKQIANRIARRLNNSIAPHLVSVGESAPLDQLRNSYLQALAIQGAQRVFPNLGRSASWSDLGVYAALATVAQRFPEYLVVPAEVNALTQERSGEVLLRTLEEFLDQAGSIGATAAALNLHRSSLYYRLQRIEEITGADLNSGRDRLTLHVGVKLARLTTLLARTHRA